MLDDSSVDLPRWRFAGHAATGLLPLRARSMPQVYPPVFSALRLLPGLSYRASLPYLSGRNDRSAPATESNCLPGAKCGTLNLLKRVLPQNSVGFSTSLVVVL